MANSALTKLSHATVRSALVERLSELSQEIESAIFARIREPAPELLADAQYIQSLRSTVGAMVHYALKTIAAGQEPPIPVPTLVTEQARLAARSGVRLKTVTRRYVAGYAVLQNFIMNEAGHFGQESLRRVLAVLASDLEQAMDVAQTAYEEEAERLGRSPEQRHAHRIERLLAGETIDKDELRYDLDRNWHVAVIATGGDARTAIALLARDLDREVLQVQRDEYTVWAWLGGRQPIASGQIERVMKAGSLSGAMLAVGESQRGLPGWRLTHRQAQAALSVAQRRPQQVTRYFEVGLDALALQDENLARQLLALYLGSLGGKDPGNKDLRQALRAYFVNDHVMESAARQLKVHRRTVEKRLVKAEELLGYDIKSRPAELQFSLRVFELLEGHA